MTFGADGIALAFLLILVIAVLGIGLLIGVVLLIVALVRVSAGKRARGLAWTGGIFTALPFVVIAMFFAYGWMVSDPDPLELDLRSDIKVKDLPGEKFPGFPAYDYDTGNVDLRLAGGARFRTPVDGAVVWFDQGSGLATGVELSQRTKTLAGGRSVAAGWADELGLPKDGLDEATADWVNQVGSDWDTKRGDRSVSIDITGEGNILIWARMGVPDKPSGE